MKLRWILTKDIDVLEKLTHGEWNKTELLRLWLKNSNQGSGMAIDNSPDGISENLSGFIIYHLGGRNGTKYLNVDVIYGNTNKDIDFLIKYILKQNRKVFIPIDESQYNAYQIAEALKSNGFSTRGENGKIIGEYPPLDRSERRSSFKNFVTTESYGSRDKRLHSWMSPNGTIYPVEPLEDHTLWIKDNKDIWPEEAFKLGWLRITYYGGYGDIYLFVHNDFQKPNYKQMPILIDLAIENNLKHIEFDGGKKSARIIWQRHD